MNSLRKPGNPVLAILLLIALTASIAPVNARLEAHSPETLAEGDLGPLPDGSALRILSLGFERLVADMFWIRTLYYMGDPASYRAGFPAADRLAELVTDVDPEFRTVYVLMGSALSVLQGKPHAAAQLLEKGVRHVEYWKLEFLLGFTYFFELLDNGRAAPHIARAAQMPGGPKYLAQFAARLYHNAGDPDIALDLIQTRIRTEEDEATRAALQKRAWDIWINRDLERIDTAIQQYGARHGTLPASVDVLVETDLLERTPVDPRGGSYFIADGVASTSLPYEKLDVYLGAGAGAHRPRIVEDSSRP